MTGDRVMRTSLLTTAAAAIVVTVAGCATPYQSLGVRGGYSDYRISADVFSVSFRGNSSTREETVEKYLLRRASEVTPEHGFNYFVGVSEKGRSARDPSAIQVSSCPLSHQGQPSRSDAFTIHRRSPNHRSTPPNSSASTFPRL